MAKAKSPKKKSSARRKSGDTIAKTKEQIQAEDGLPVSDVPVRAPKIDPHPVAPEGYEIGDRVVIPDMGSRHGEIEQYDEKEQLLLVKLDGPIVHPDDPTMKVSRIEIECDRVRVCHGSRAA